MTTGSRRVASSEARRSSDAAAGVVWALHGKRPGDNSQIDALARATGLDWIAKPLRFRKGLEALPNLRRGGSLFSLTSESQAALKGPPPDVVIAAGKRSAPAALWLRARTGARLVHLGRTWAPPEWFDLVITTPQYRQPRSSNVVENRFPLSEALNEAVIPIDLASLPRPRILIVTGGDARPLVFDAAAARRLIEQAMERCREAQGSLLVVTSPRTSPNAVAALRGLLERSTSPVRLSVFGQGENRYQAFLAAADAIVVTNDSVSMITEAAMTGRPVTLFELPERFDLAGRTAGMLSNCGSLARSALKELVRRGLIDSGRGIGDYGRGLARDGLLDGGVTASALTASELADAARRVTALAALDRLPG